MDEPFIIYKTYFFNQILMKLGEFVHSILIWVLKDHQVSSKSDDKQVIFITDLTDFEL